MSSRVAVLDVVSTATLEEESLDAARNSSAREGLAVRTPRLTADTVAMMAMGAATWMALGRRALVSRLWRC